MTTLSLNQEPEFNLDAFENFELNQAKSERDEALAKAEALQQQLKEQKLSHVDEISAIKKKEGVVIDPIGHVIDILQRVPAMESLIQNLQSEMIDLAEIAQSAEADKTYLAETLEKTLDAARIAASQRDKLSGELENATRQLDNDLLVIADKQAKLKALTALNPERLAKKNKELQAKNRDLNERHVRNMKVMKERATQIKELTEANELLAKQKAGIEAGFAKLHSDMKDGTATSLLNSFKHWEIHSDADDYMKQLVVCKKTDSVRIFKDGKFLKPGRMDEEVVEQLIVNEARNVKAAKSLDYQGAA